MSDIALVDAEAREVQVVPEEMSLEQVKQRVQKLHQVMRELMREEQHYGTIPGTDKPTLYLAGAQLLDMTFRFAPKFEIQEKDLGNGHREDKVITTLIHVPTGTVVGQGVGSCSTLESKYRYRKQYLEDEVGSVPKAYWETKREDSKARDRVLVETFGPGKYRIKKTEGQWKVYRITGDSERIENPDIADTYNTILKMAKKRSLVDATITACAASDVLTQDLEDFAEEGNNTPVTKKEAPAAPQAAKQEAQAEASATASPRAKELYRQYEAKLRTTKVLDEKKRKAALDVLPKHAGDIAYLEMKLLQLQAREGEAAQAERGEQASGEPALFSGSNPDEIPGSTDIETDDKPPIY